MKKRRKEIRWVIIVILIATLLYSGIKLVQYQFDRSSSERLNDTLQEYYYGSAASTTEESSTQEVGKDDIASYQNRFDQLLNINSSIVGWIRIPQTDVDYPVVQGKDNDYYLKHNVENGASAHGAIFMDYRNRSQDVNTIIYGHYMRDGSMFGSLKNYKDKDYYQEHKTIEFDTLLEETTWEIFAVYVIQEGDNTLQASFTEDEAYLEYIQRITNKAIYPTNIEVTASDQMLTLVTCSYDYNNARLVIHAKKK